MLLMARFRFCFSPRRHARWHSCTSERILFPRTHWSRSISTRASQIVYHAEDRCHRDFLIVVSWLGSIFAARSD
ncbi:hypothetical protein J1614_000871 [Plenodomus biglobosus]|nr:hypothetical protein J1614_000871 [Plenodomus biglobosus]